MSKFDTHGGYFAPKDYMRVNEGGSHEENPNGGVQVGVDPEGNPNLLEEGEPVYKDYVYSDNIEAEEKFLVDNNLPKKYAGKLYSKIADDLFSEAEERPLDPISNNGLEVLLGRLADAQEAQKQEKEQRELENELANLSPEELDQLEAMLAQGQLVGTDNPAYGEGPVGPEGEPGIPPEQMGPAMPVEQIPIQMPMMANGGFLRVFGDGTPGKIITDDELARAIRERSEKERLASENKKAKANATLDLRLASVKHFFDKIEASNAKRNLDRQSNLLSQMKELYVNGERIGLGFREEDELTRQQKRVEKAEARNEKAQQRLNSSIQSMTDARNQVNALHSPLVGNVVPLEYPEPDVNAPGYVGPIDTTGMNLPVDSLDVDVNFDDKPGKVFILPSGGRSRVTRADGGSINRFDGGGWADFLKRLADYRYSKNPSAAAGKYSIDRRYDVWGGRTAKDIEADKAYQDFTNYVLANSDNADVRAYLKALDEGVADGVPLLFNGDELVSGWDEMFRHRRTDGDLGIYHLNPEDIGFLTAPAEPAVPAPEPQNGLVTVPVGGLRGINTGMMYDWVRRNPTGTSYVPKENKPTLFPGMELTWNGLKSQNAVPAEPQNNEEEVTETRNMPILPTWPRYAGAVGSGLLGLYNVFQSPDRYYDTKMPVYTPEGRIHLQNQVYNPVDQNMIANTISAQGNATNRALRNSGLGPSTAASILAADNNTTGNLGTGFIQGWDANNQRRNAVIAANNQAEAQRAQFDANMDYYRTMALNNGAYYNAQNDLMLQRLNNEAEGQKYAAISNQISNGLQALSGIGKENFAMNQINTNPYFIGYGVGPNGAQFYNPYLWKKEKKNKNKGE